MNIITACSNVIAKVSRALNFEVDLFCQYLSVVSIISVTLIEILLQNRPKNKENRSKTVVNGIWVTK